MPRIAVLGCGRIGRMHAENIHAQGAPLMNFFIERYGQAFAAEIDAFVDAVEGATAPAVGFEDGHRALVLAEAALRSIREGRPVQVSDVA